MNQNLTVWFVRSKGENFADGLFFPSRFIYAFFHFALVVLYPFPSLVILSHIRELSVTLCFYL